MQKKAILIIISGFKFKNHIYLETYSIWVQKKLIFDTVY